MKYFVKQAQQGPTGIIATQLLESAPTDLPIIPKKEGAFYKNLLKKLKSYFKDREKIASLYKTLKSNQVPLTKEERELVMSRKAIWHHGPNGEPSPAVWKSIDKNGNITFITNTHRAMNTAPTLKGAISRYHKFIKSTA